MEGGAAPGFACIHDCASVDHSLVFVVLELKDIVGRVRNRKILMPFDFLLESLAHFDKQGDLAFHYQSVKQEKIVSILKGGAEMSWIESGFGVDFCWRQMANQLPAEEVERHPVAVAAGQFESQTGIIKILRGVQVVARNGDMKNGVHVLYATSASKVSKRRFWRKVSSETRSDKAMFAKFTSAPNLRMK
jgi:hypothetical protein